MGSLQYWGNQFSPDLIFLSDSVTDCVSGYSICDMLQTLKFE